MTEITIKLPRLTEILLTDRADNNGSTIEQEAELILRGVQAEALRKALRSPSRNLRDILAVLVDMGDEYIPLSILTQKSGLHKESSVRNTLAWLNRGIEGAGYLYWSDLLEYSEGGYRLPAHLRAVVREVLER